MDGWMDGWREGGREGGRDRWIHRSIHGQFISQKITIQTGNQRLHRNLKMSKHRLLYFVVFEVCSLTFTLSFPKQYCNN